MAPSPKSAIEAHRSDFLFGCYKHLGLGPFIVGPFPRVDSWPGLLLYRWTPAEPELPETRGTLDRQRRVTVQVVIDGVRQI